MPTQAEEQQVREFLKRAEVRTMKKDLQNLREADALKERYKIVKIKTLEEQRQEQERRLKQAEREKQEAEKAKRERVLSENEREERSAEKQLKEYATEEERQQVFLLEAQRLSFGNKILEIDGKKDPALKLEKNKLLLERRDWEAKLKATSEGEAKLDTEENFINEKAEQSGIPEEKKSLEKRRWEIEDQRKEMEKKRWEIETQLQNIDKRISQTDKLSQQLVSDRNNLNQKILGIDKSLRDIYSGVIARVEEKRRGQAEEQRAKREALAKTRSEAKEKIQRQQWTGADRQVPNNIPVPTKAAQKKKFEFEAEEEQRKQFMKDVENWAEGKEKTNRVAPQAPKKAI